MLKWPMPKTIVVGHRGKFSKREILYYTYHPFQFVERKSITAPDVRDGGIT